MRAMVFRGSTGNSCSTSKASGGDQTTLYDAACNCHLAVGAC